MDVRARAGAGLHDLAELSKDPADPGKWPGCAARYIGRVGRTSRRSVAS